MAADIVTSGRSWQREACMRWMSGDRAPQSAVCTMRYHDLRRRQPGARGPSSRSSGEPRNQPSQCERSLYGPKNTIRRIYFTKIPTIKYALRVQSLLARLWDDTGSVLLEQHRRTRNVRLSSTSPVRPQRTSADSPSSHRIQLQSQGMNALSRPVSL